MDAETIRQLNKKIDQLAFHLQPQINLPMFTGKIGDTSWIDWIERFELEARCISLTSLQKILILPTLLAPYPLLEYKQLSQNTRSSFKETVQSFTEIFQPACLTEFYSNALQLRHQLKGEPCSEFYVSLILLIKGAFPNLNESQTEAFDMLLMSFFKNGLISENIRDKLLTAAPKTSKEMIMLAKNFEAYEMLLNKTIPSTKDASVHVDKARQSSQGYYSNSKMHVNSVHAYERKVCDEPCPYPILPSTFRYFWGRDGIIYQTACFYCSSLNHYYKNCYLHKTYARNRQQRRRNSHYFYNNNSFHNFSKFNVNKQGYRPRPNFRSRVHDYDYEGNHSASNMYQGGAHARVYNVFVKKRNQKLW